jgi:hypothetical protein
MGTSLWRSCLPRSVRRFGAQAPYGLEVREKHLAAQALQEVSGLEPVHHRPFDLGQVKQDADILEARPDVFPAHQASCKTVDSCGNWHRGRQGEHPRAAARQYTPKKRCMDAVSDEVFSASFKRTAFRS